MAKGLLGEIVGQADIRVNEGMWLLDDDDYALIAMLRDPVFCAELLFDNPLNHDYGGCYTVLDYQVPLFRPKACYQAFPCGRSLGKTESIKARAVSHVFKRSGEDLLVTAPELIHLEPLTQAIEERITATRLTRDFLRKDSQKTGFTHKPFLAVFTDGTQIVGRIPRLDGRGVKGMHEPDMIIDEAQDYPERGWIEAHETCMKDHVDSTGAYDFTYHFYGVHAGSRGGKFNELSMSGNYKVTSITALMKPGWNKREKAAAAAMYGGTSSPDYRRNILGEPGTALSAFFVMSRLMACFASDTLVATKDGARRIDAIRPGDEVRNAAGWGTVMAVPVSAHGRVAVVKLNTGEEIVCSPEHPFFAEYGWCHADQLAPGQRIYRQSEALRGLRGGAEDTPGSLLLQELRRDMAGQHGSPQVGTAAPPMPSVRGVLRAVRCGSVLFAGVRNAGSRLREAPAPEALRDLWRCLPTPEANDSVLLAQVLGGQGGGCQHSPSGPPDSPRGDDSHGRPAEAAVCRLDGPWRTFGRLVRAVLCRAKKQGARGEAPTTGHRVTDSDGGRGDRRDWAPGAGSGGEGRAPGSLAPAVRVDSVTIHEPGSDGWARHCGSGDSVQLYDLTVGGHPSFAVGDQGLLVHNCVDQDSDSKYNTVTFKAQELQAEEVDKMIPAGGDVGTLLDLPQGLGQQVYCGMDIGLVTDPTVIMLFAVIANELKLIRMIHLWRFREKQIRQITYQIARMYGKTLRAFGQDITGLGLPLYQAMEDDEECPEHLKEVSRGYVFNAKMPVAVDPNYVSKEGDRLVDQYGHLVEVVRDKWTGRETLVAKMTMIEASTRYLRKFVDDGFLRIPFLPPLVGDMQGETEQRVRAMAGMKKKPNAFHMLDAMRAMAMAYMSASVEEQVYAQQPTAVMDRAVTVPLY